MYASVDIHAMFAYDDIMQVRTARETGALIRQRRQSLELTQAQLAKAVGVTRAWVIAIEQGKSTAELNLVLRTLGALGLVADVVAAPLLPDAMDLEELLRS
jgi:y4mF family transcriptional regulator